LLIADWQVSQFNDRQHTSLSKWQKGSPELPNLTNAGKHMPFSPTPALMLTADVKNVNLFQMAGAV
jgi:hypothetical protein